MRTNNLFLFLDPHLSNLSSVEKNTSTFAFSAQAICIASYVVKPKASIFFVLFKIFSVTVTYLCALLFIEVKRSRLSGSLVFLISVVTTSLLTKEYCLLSIFSKIDKIASASR